MTDNKNNGEDSDFEMDSDELILVPKNVSPLIAPTKKFNIQDTPTKNKYTSQKVYRNDLNRPKISANKLKPILENGISLHEHSTKMSSDRVSLRYKAPSSSSSSSSTPHSRGIQTSPYKRPTTSSSRSDYIVKKPSLISKMKTKTESNRFCPIYDINKIMIGTKFLPQGVVNNFTQLKYIDEEFIMIAAANSKEDDVIIKHSVIDGFSIHDKPAAIYMTLKKVPKNFPHRAEVRVFSTIQSQRYIVFYFDDNTDISSNAIDKFKEIFDDCWNTANINKHIFDSIGSTESIRHVSPGSPTCYDTIISDYLENGDHHIDIESNGSSDKANEVVFEIHSSPDKPIENSNSKQPSEIDVENSTQESTPNETNGDVKNAQPQSPSVGLTTSNKSPTDHDHDTSIYNHNSLIQTPSPVKESPVSTPTSRRSGRISLRPISPDFDPETTRWVTENSNNDNVLTYKLPNNKSITIHGDDLQRLKSGIFLNDTLIEFYSQWLLANYKEDDPEIIDQVYISNPFFFTFIQKGNFERLRKWTSKVDLFGKKYVFIPINENLHWYLALICNLPNYNPSITPDPKDPLPSNPIIFIFDSLKLKHPKTFEQLELFLLEEYKFRNPEKFKTSSLKKDGDEDNDNDNDILCNPKLTIHTYTKVVGQNNFSDCGVYLLYYLKNILANRKEQKKLLIFNRTIELKFDANMKEMRREIVKTIQDQLRNQDLPNLLELIDDLDTNNLNQFKSDKSLDNIDEDDLIMED